MVIFLLRYKYKVLLFAFYLYFYFLTFSDDSTGDHAVYYKVGHIVATAAAPFHHVFILLSNVELILCAQVHIMLYS